MRVITLEPTSAMPSSLISENLAADIIFASITTSEDHATEAVEDVTLSKHVNFEVGQDESVFSSSLRQTFMNGSQEVEHQNQRDARAEPSPTDNSHAQLQLSVSIAAVRSGFTEEELITLVNAAKIMRKRGLAGEYRDLVKRTGVEDDPELKEKIKNKAKEFHFPLVEEPDPNAITHNSEERIYWDSKAVARVRLRPVSVDTEIGTNEIMPPKTYKWFVSCFSFSDKKKKKIGSLSNLPPLL